MSAAVGIVVPTYNEERNIGRLLRSIAAQENVQYEVVIVDEHSSDRTLEIARSFCCNILSVPERRNYMPPGANRNLGARALSTEILLHLDADMELPDRHFLERLVRAFDNWHRAVVIHESDIASGFWSRCKALERRCYLDSPLEAARAVTREFFLEVGGYDDEIVSGEDLHLSVRYQRVTRLRSAGDLYLWHHTGAPSLGRLLMKKYRYGMGAVAFARRAGAFGPRFIVRESMRAYLRNISYLKRDPLHFVGMIWLRLLEYVAVQLGMLARGSSP